MSVAPLFPSVYFFFGSKAPMDPQALYRTLEGTFNIDNNVRQQAEAQLKQAESHPGYLGIIFQAACADQVRNGSPLQCFLALPDRLPLQLCPCMNPAPHPPTHDPATRLAAGAVA